MSDVYNWLDRVSKCGVAEAETAAKILKDYYEGAGQPQPKNQLNVTFSVDMTSMLLNGIPESDIKSGISQLLKTSDLKFAARNLQTSIWYNHDATFMRPSDEAEPIGDAPTASGLYRVIPHGDGFMPQMSYSMGMVAGLQWFPLNVQGFWNDPDSFSFGKTTKELPIPMTKDDAERAIERAKLINDCQPIIRPTPVNVESPFAGVSRDETPVCEECDLQMIPFAFNGEEGFACQGCGWSVDT